LCPKCFAKKATEDAIIATSTLATTDWMAEAEKKHKVLEARVAEIESASADNFCPYCGGRVN